MPTFQSIGVHPALRSRLVTQSSVIAAAASSAAADEAPGTDPTKSTTSAEASSSVSLVETPLALLACHPDSLRLLDPASGKCQAIDIDQVTELRQQVAEAIISETRDGLHVDRVRRCLLVAASRDGHLSSSSSVVEGGAGPTASVKRRRLSASNVENENRSNAMHASDDAVDFTIPSKELDALSTKNDSRLFGALTSLELLKYESMLRGQNQSSSHPPEAASLTTGCRQLDVLVSCPAEYDGIVAAVSSSVCEGVGWQEPPPPQGIGRSGGGGGVPRGYVTQLYGPPASGKTQVALHVAAHRFRASRAATAAQHSTAHPASASADAEQKAARFPCWLLVPPASQVSCAERIASLAGDDPAVMSETYFHPVSNIYQVLSALVAVEEALLSAAAPGSHLDVQGASTEFVGATGLAPPALIVLDSASACCCCSDPNSDESQRLTSQLAKTLKRIARHHLAAVVVTNGSIKMTTPTSVGSAPPEAKRTLMLPALGRIWERAVDIQVKVEEARGSQPPNAAPDVRRATLTRHPAKSVFVSGSASTTAAFFSIHPTLGIREATGSVGSAKA